MVGLESLTLLSFMRAKQFACEKGLPPCWVLTDWTGACFTLGAEQFQSKQDCKMIDFKQIEEYLHKWFCTDLVSDLQEQDSDDTINLSKNTAVSWHVRKHSKQVTVENENLFSISKPV